MFEIQKDNPAETDKWHFDRITGFDGGTRNLKIAASCRGQAVFPTMTTVEERFEALKSGRGSFWDFRGHTTQSAGELIRWARYGHGEAVGVKRAAGCTTVSKCVSRRRGMAWGETCGILLWLTRFYRFTCLCSYYSFFLCSEDVAGFPRGWITMYVHMPLKTASTLLLIRFIHSVYRHRYFTYFI